MKKYSFRLNNVLRVRKVQEDIAKSALLSANNEVQSAISAVEQRVDAYVSHSPSVGRSTVDMFMRQRYFNELAGEAILAAKASHAAAVAMADVKRAAFTDAARQSKAIERLEERSRDEYNIEYLREMDREMDELATSRFPRPERTRTNRPSAEPRESFGTSAASPHSEGASLGSSGRTSFGRPLRTALS